MGPPAGCGSVDPTALQDLFAFLQCQLRMEARERLRRDIELQDQRARDLWPHFEAWVKPNLGKREKWMPFHTVLGVHELFAVQEIHNSKSPCWDDKRKFLVLFVYRTHCRRELFSIQRPHLEKESFWDDPVEHFSQQGSVTQAMLDYRRGGGTMQTQAFRCIPKRLVEDDDTNLVLNVARRTQMLLEVAERVWPIVKDPSRSSAEKFDAISAEILRGRGIGETWAKMLMVSVDIAYPSLKLLAAKCEVGIGALGGLEKLLPGSRVEDDRSAALEAVAAAANAKPKAGEASAALFWEMLPKVERWASDEYRDFPLVLEQMRTPVSGLSAVTVQVQLCEWRQFNEYLSKRQLDASFTGPCKELPSAVAAVFDDDDDDLLSLSQEDSMPLAAFCLPRRPREAPAPSPPPPPSTSPTASGRGAEAPEERGGRPKRRRKDDGAEAGAIGAAPPAAEPGSVEEVVDSIVYDMQSSANQATCRLNQLRNDHIARAAALASAERAVAESEASCRVTEGEISRAGLVCTNAESRLRQFEEHTDALQEAMSQSQVDLDRGILLEGVAAPGALGSSASPGSGAASVAAQASSHGDGSGSVGGVEVLRRRLAEKLRPLAAGTPTPAREAAEGRWRKALELSQKAASEAEQTAHEEHCKLLEEYERKRESGKDALRRVTESKAALEVAKDAFSAAEQAVRAQQQTVGAIRLRFVRLLAEAEYAKELALHSQSSD